MSTLLQEQESLERQIREHAIKILGYDPEKIAPITDGVADAEGYRRSSPRIMWILKEAYDDNDGGWSRTEEFRQRAAAGTLADMVQHGGARGGPVPTFYKMIYVTEGIRHKGLKRGEMQHYTRLCRHLMDVVLLNINKMPAEGGTNSRRVMTAEFENWKDIVMAQIEVYDPQVIIFGYSFQYFRDARLFPGAQAQKDADNVYGQVVFKYKDKLLVDAYHPQIYTDEMIDSIVRSIHRYL